MGQGHLSLRPKRMCDLGPKTLVQVPTPTMRQKLCFIGSVCPPDYLRPSLLCSMPRGWALLSSASTWVWPVEVGAWRTVLVFMPRAPSLPPGCRLLADGFLFCWPWSGPGSPVTRPSQEPSDSFSLSPCRPGRRHGFQLWPPLGAASSLSVSLPQWQRSSVAPSSTFLHPPSPWNGPSISSLLLY